MRLSRIASGFRALLVLFCVVATITPSFAAERILLARASKLGLEIFVLSHDKENWCNPVVTLYLFAKEPSIYDTGDFESLVPKLGSLVASQCPSVLELILQGFDSNGGSQVLNAVAIAKDDWALQVLN